MIADVEQPRTDLDAEHGVKMRVRTSLVHLGRTFTGRAQSTRERALVRDVGHTAYGGQRCAVIRVVQQSRRRVHFKNGRRIVGEEARFRRTGDDDVEQTEPFQSLGVADVVVDEIIHHDVGVIPQRIREQKHLFAARAHGFE